MEATLDPSPSVPWLIRISEVFVESEQQIIHSLGAVPVRRLGKEFHLIRTEHPARIHQSDAAKFVRWNIPVHHSWPCNPQETTGFIEKAAQALFRKFDGNHPQAIFIGPLDPGSSNRYFHTLASNLRGRTLQLFPAGIGAIRDPEEQDSDAPALYGLLGREGLFCGIQSPRMSSGFYPGGTKFIPQNAAGTISRAGAKIAEALHHLRLERPVPKDGAHWLELGASPGGMTAELLKRGYRVTAVDRAPLDGRLGGAAGLIPVLADVAAFRPAGGMRFDAILSDMNGDARESITQVVRLSRFLHVGGLVVFTLKMPGVASFDEANSLEKSVVEIAEAGGLQLFFKKHLTYNRQEFTLIFERQSESSRSANVV